MTHHPFENIVLATHAFLENGQFNVRSGPTRPLLEFFLPNCHRFFLIGQPPPFIKDSLAPFLFVYETGKPRLSYISLWFHSMYDIPKDKRRVMTSFKLKLRDFFSVFYFSRIIKKKIGNQSIDYFISVESVNAVAAGLIRGILPVRSSVYYAFDWSVKWFDNPVLNLLYIQFDKWACRLSDFCWNASHRIEKARQEILSYGHGILGNQRTVPFGMMTFREDLVQEYPRRPYNKVVFCGELSYENGALMLPDIAKNLLGNNPDIQLIIIGGGELFEEIRTQIETSKLENVSMLGHLSNQSEIDRILADCHLAVAPYLALPYSKKRFGDVIKIRNYFACGLPVVTTNVPPIADEVSSELLGAVVSPDPSEIAVRCVALLEDQNAYIHMRKNVIQKAKTYHWKVIYQKTFRDMEIHPVRKTLHGSYNYPKG